MKHIGIFVATRWECQAVRGAMVVERVLARPRRLAGRCGAVRVTVVQTGMGPDRAGKVARQLMSREQFDWVISSGFAGALIPARVGDILIGSEVIDWSRQSAGSRKSGAEGPGERWPCDEVLIEGATRAGHAKDLTMHCGLMVTVPRVLWDANEKRRLAALAKAIGVDMESAAIGAAAAERRLPFGVVRAVSDLRDDALPVDFNAFLHLTGWISAVSTCLRPSRLRALWKLRRDSLEAGARLTTLFAQLVPLLDRSSTRKENAP